MSPPPSDSAALDLASAAAPEKPSRPVVITVLGVTQILAWGSTFYLLAVLAPVIVAETGWAKTFVVGGLTLGLVAASLVSPRVGRAVEATGGRPVLVGSALTMAAGLAALGLAAHPLAYLAAWLVIGLGMGAGLYDAAFATLGRLYGASARSAITTLTLFGGFASTIGWPLSALFVEQLGWRGACFAYAAIHVLVVAPLYLTLLPRRPAPAPHAAPVATPATEKPADGARRLRDETLLRLTLAAGLTVSGLATAVLSVHLITLLQARDLALAAAVGLAAMVGPSQVGARVIEAWIGRRYHPIRTAAASAALTFAGVALLASGNAAILPLALVCYGAGIGIRSIVKGTLPLAIFGPFGYAALMGRLALPQLLVAALAPLAGAWLMETIGPDALLHALIGVTTLDALLVLAIALQIRGR
ncbi:MFS transporter [Salinarimonas ramus]|uniref:MFS transporter n=1 Tax=Salinarimonas ramus TaxID=690164 RepID=A0A917QCF8_9HYPH|nr:MFS transporter [Salinarimonas ramus]GGK43667.1 MFS transporter [Salinarimonas ramus]